jgi:lactate dehydrogenase-like 2-hydroxyacid dehydrogenase
MARIEVLQLCGLSQLLEEELQRRFVVHRWHEASDRERLVNERGASIRGVVTGGHIGIPPELMARLPALGIVAINGVGFDKVDLDECRRRGIRVTTTPNALTDDVADLAVGLVISLLRQIPGSDRYVRAGQWANGDMPLGRKVSGKRFGIVGLGNIGKAIADRLSRFGSVSYYDVLPQRVPYAFVPSVGELAGQSDVLILAATANASSRGFIDRDILNALGSKGYLINAARGSLVNESDLMEALVEGRIAGAALDVFADEPRVPETLRTAPNVVLTPHIASATVETREAMARLVLANLDAFFAGQPLPGAIV